jgi:hypothetical protein
MTAQDAIAVILSDVEHYGTTLNYAVNYCKAACGMTGEELRVQCLYILSNLSQWRHPKAKEVRAALKATSKTK